MIFPDGTGLFLLYLKGKCSTPHSKSNHSFSNRTWGTFTIRCKVSKNELKVNDRNVAWLMLRSVSSMPNIFVHDIKSVNISVPLPISSVPVCPHVHHYCFRSLVHCSMLASIASSNFCPMSWIFLKNHIQSSLRSHLIIFFPLSTTISIAQLSVLGYS